MSNSHSNNSDTVKKRIIIHTGPGKTGSSAIQAWLRSNNQFLTDNGIYYPKHKLAKDKISSGNLRAILSESKNAKHPNGDWFVDATKIASLLTDFRASASSLLLLSSEFFFHRMIEIKKQIPEAEFIAYIRNPVELLESNYNQTIKRHGKLEKFIAPQSLAQFFWQYITKAFNTLGTEDMHLRPYDETLMVGNNIVSDLLSVLGVVKSVDNKRINPSFTFASLEFKRLLNHFELGPLEPKVDIALQGCNLGCASYSLMSPDDFERLNHQSCLQMKLFIDKFKQYHLLPLFENFSNATQRPYLKQDANLLQLSAVAKYLQNVAKPLYFQLQAVVALHNNLCIDNQLIYNAFGISTSDEKLSDEKLLEHIKTFESDTSKQGKIASELCEYFTDKADWDNAVSFAKVAYSLNTNQAVLQLQLNRLLIQNNLQSTCQNVVEQKLSIKIMSKRLLKYFIALFNK